jgi:hypothetical protein
MRIIHGVEARLVVGDFIGGHSYLRLEGFRFGLAPAVPCALCCDIPKP